MSYIFNMNTIYVIYLSVLILGVILFSILNFKVLKEIRKSAETYKRILEKNLRLTKDTLNMNNDKGIKQKHKVEEEVK